jgi:hypothetical protein
MANREECVTNSCWGCCGRRMLGEDGCDAGFDNGIVTKRLMEVGTLLLVSLHTFFSVFCRLKSGPSGSSPTTAPDEAWVRGSVCGGGTYGCSCCCCCDCGRRVSSTAAAAAAAGSSGDAASLGLGLHSLHLFLYLPCSAQSAEPPQSLQ